MPILLKTPQASQGNTNVNKHGQAQMSAGEHE